MFANALDVESRHQEREMRHSVRRGVVHGTASAASKQPPASPATSSADSINPQGPRSSIKSIKKDDMDAILEQVPSGLRKRFGF